MQNFGEMIHLDIIRCLILISVLTCAVYQDVRYLKIKNNLNLTVLLIGLFCAILQGFDSIVFSLWGILIPFVIGFVLYAFRMFGAGDVKFLMALGALMGKEWIISCMIYSILAGGILSIGVMLHRGIFIERMRYAWNYFKAIFLTKKLMKYQILDNKKKQFFPFAISIACGSILACILPNPWAW